MNRDRNDTTRSRLNKLNTNSRAFLVLSLGIATSIATSTVAARTSNNIAPTNTQNIIETYVDMSVAIDVDSLGDGLMGERIDVDTGTIAFAHTDVSLPGNSDLEVRFGRIRSGHRRRVIEGKLLGDWDLDIPHLLMRVEAGQTGPANRCTGDPISGPEWIQIGLALHTPGEGTRQVFTPDASLTELRTPAPEKMTEDYWLIDCGIGLQNGPGEGFMVTAPNGDTYRFDKLVTLYMGQFFNASTLSNTPADNALFFPTEVTDINGNWVRYEYNDYGPTRIHSNDGRQIDINYNSTGQQITSVVANGRQWTYGYSSNNLRLTSVTRPDGRSWTLSMASIDIRNENGVCHNETAAISLTHPSGASAIFRMRGVRQLSTGTPSFVYGGSRVEYRCMGPGFPFPAWYYTKAVTSKELTIPGANDLIWTYDYQEDPLYIASEPGSYVSGYFWDPSVFHAGPKTRTIIDPAGHKTIHYVNREFGPWNGSVEKTERYASSGSSTPIEVEEFVYTQNPFFLKGVNYLPNHITFPHQQTPTVEKRILSRGTDQYTTEYVYDVDRASATFGYGEPKTVKTSSTLQTGERTFDTEYYHLKPAWIIGKISKTTHSGKTFLEYDYDSLGRVSEIKRFGSVLLTLGYHTGTGESGTIAWSKDGLDKQTNYNNFKRGLPQTIDRPDGVTVSRVVDDNGWTTSTTNARGYETTYQFDNAIGRLTRVIPPQNNGVAADTVITYSHTVDGLTQTVTRDRHRSTRFYDGMYRLYLEKEEDTSDSSTVSYTRTGYDGLGRTNFSSFPAATSTAATGVETIYDALSRIVETRQNVAPFASTTTLYLADNQVRVTDPRGNTTTTTYSGYAAPDLDRPTLIDRPLGASTTITYDIWGNRLTETQGAAQTSFVYDSSLRLYSTTDPDSRTSYTYYDAASSPIVTVDAENRKTRTVYDDLGRPEKVIKAWRGNNVGSGSTLDCDTMRSNYSPSTGYLQQCYQLYDYWPTGKIKTVTDANGNVTKYDYDAHERQTHIYFPSKIQTGAWSATDFEQYSYDPLGYLESKKTRSGDTILFNYDGLGRLVDRLVPDAPTHTANGRTVTHDFTYDVAGRYLTATHDGMTIAYVYDAVGRLDSQTHGGAAPVSFGYDAANNLKTLTYPDGWEVGYEYDELNRVYVARDGTRTLASVEYDDLLRREVVTYDNGTSASYAYTDRGDLRCHSWNFTGATPADCDDAGAELAYDYTYNGVRQIISTSVSDSSYVWQPGAIATDTYVVNGLNQYTTITPGGGSAMTIVHDMNGNVVADQENRSFIYDAENVLRTASGLSFGATATYRYWPNGSRRQKDVTTSGTTSTSKFYYWGDQEIAEYRDPGAAADVLERRYVRLPGSIDEPFLMIDYSGGGAGTERWAHQDRMGSVVAVTDSTGGVVETFTYSPYGASGVEGDYGFPFRFTGQKLDSETGLYYYKARYYDPEVGRFLQTDPIGYADNMNMYAYVGNDPMNVLDPTGMSGCMWSSFCEPYFMARFDRPLSNEFESEAAGLDRENDDDASDVLARIDAFIEENPGEKVPLSLEEFRLILDEQAIVTKAQVGDGVSVMVYITTIRDAGGDGRFFELPYRDTRFKIDNLTSDSGALGGDINYTVIGMITAANGYSDGLIRSLVVVHNVKDIYDGKSVLHNLRQIYTGRKWATLGHAYYLEVMKNAD